MSDNEGKPASDIYAELRNTLAACGARAPWSLDEEEVGSILDADKRTVLTVDVPGERPDEEAAKIALLIITAVNTCAGFRAERA